VAHVNVPPQSAATPSILAPTAAFIRLCPILASMVVPEVLFVLSNKTIFTMLIHVSVFRFWEWGETTFK
jgi:hypothetical protein